MQGLLGMPGILHRFDSGRRLCRYSPFVATCNKCSPSRGPRRRRILELLEIDLPRPEHGGLAA